MTSASCPSCGTTIILASKPKIGQSVSCTKCKSKLEIVWLEPVELDWPFDYDDEDLEDLSGGGQDDGND